MSQFSTRFGIILVALIGCFSLPLYQLFRFGLQNDLYSHVILIPFVSLYLIWINRSQLPEPSEPDRRIALAFFALGALTFAAGWYAPRAGFQFAPDDDLAASTLSFLFFLVGTCAWFLGRKTLRALAFPLAFLVFMVPFPTGFRSGLETFLQHGSAQVALRLFNISGTTVYYHDLVFRLTTISLQVAPECSGIRSSLALFITSVIAGHFFLRTPWKCAALTLAVIPLAILRNGFRIFTLGELCVHISPDMIDSYIHHHGGPVFFVLSLIPFFFLLRFLYRTDQRSKASNRGTP